MKLIIAQGNPGTQYTQTRHNVGFLALDFYIAKHGLEFLSKPKFMADIAETIVNNEKVLLAKPTTYYNETGRAARALADFYKIDATDILVVHDELALPFGTVRTREKGSDAGNNGIKSLNTHLGESYVRIRIGTANELAEKMSAHDFVLSRFSKEESEKLQKDVLPKITELIDDFINDTHTTTSYTL